MIYLCQTCGYRINQRTCDGSTWRPDSPLRRNTQIKAEDVGKHLLYNHKPFCSVECIDVAKKIPYIMKREVIPSNDFEKGSFHPDRPNGIETWKTERKIKRNQSSSPILGAK